MAQKVKYETTKVSVAQTAAEIAGLLARHKVASIATDYDTQGNPVAVRCTMRHQGQFLPVVLRPSTKKILKIISENSWKAEYELEDKAARIAWRNLKGLTEHLLEAAHIGIKSLPNIFMADIEVPDPESEHGYTTLGRVFEKRHQDMIAAVTTRSDRLLPPAQ